MISQQRVIRKITSSVVLQSDSKLQPTTAVPTKHTGVWLHMLHVLHAWCVVDLVCRMSSVRPYPCFSACAVAAPSVLSADTVVRYRLP